MGKGNIPKPYSATGSKNPAAMRPHGTRAATTAGGNSFNILDFTSHTGTFTSVTLPPLSGGLTWDTSQLYTTGIISVVGPHVVGDYNGNGIVGAADYMLWRDSLGSTTHHMQIAGTGTVGVADHSSRATHVHQPRLGRWTHAG
jgi:hypothetical protein